MDRKLILVGIAYVLVHVVVGQDLLCDDIDAKACELMEASKPDLCSDQTLANSACKRYCKLCPIECFHCNSTLLDYHDCNTTMLCEPEEVCMIKEMKSFIDGHHEYEMTCEAKQLCDGGADLTIPFVGKRSAEKRDLSVKCCDTDLCNYPETSVLSGNDNNNQVTACAKDIVIMVDDSSVYIQSQRVSLIRTLFDVISDLDIGPNDNLVGLYGYDSRVHEVFDLNDYTDKDDVLRHLLSANVFSVLSRGTDTDEAVEYLIEQALTPRHGDRPDYPDVVIIIGDSLLSHNTRVSLSHQQSLEQLAQDVIVVSIGGDGSRNEDLATDTDHVFHVASSRRFETDLIPGLLELIKQC